MFPPLPEQTAQFYCRKLMAAMDAGLEQKPARGGQLFGVLVCRVRHCTDESVRFDGFIEPDYALRGEDHTPPVILKAFSGTLNGRRTVDGWVPPADGQFCCADGRVRTFADILPCAVNDSIDSAPDVDYEPPAGTGDCCAPRLFSYAYAHGLEPESYAAFYYGKDSGGRTHGRFYAPCDEKCSLVLPAVLGLEILYRDDDIVVVNKPAGLLTVPGNGAANQDCVAVRIRRLFPQCIPQPCPHRLDQDTSGIVVLALTQRAHAILSAEFAEGAVHKRYEALLRGTLPDGACSGRLELPFRVDPDNRPRQVYDAVNGKTGITLWQKIREETYTLPAVKMTADGAQGGFSEKMSTGGAAAAAAENVFADTAAPQIVTRVVFTPLTGRTHQLRLAAADQHGLGIPIVGDRLYGTRLAGERLMLHAGYISFIHPVTGVRLEFTIPAKFGTEKRGKIQR